MDTTTIGLVAIVAALIIAASAAYTSRTRGVGKTMTPAQYRQAHERKTAEVEKSRKAKIKADRNREALMGRKWGKASPEQMQQAEQTCKAADTKFQRLMGELEELELRKP